jgi:hypothetical protein
MTKTCNKCGVELIPWENWYQSHMIHCDYVCKGCHSARMKERYASDPNARAKIKEYSRKWYEKNRDRVNAYQRVYQRAYWRRNKDILNKRLSVCSILKSHADELSDDPERLSTDFIVGLLKVVEE